MVFKNYDDVEPQSFTQTAGLAVLHKELTKTKVLETIDSQCKKHSGFLLSDVICTGIYKNICGIKTFTETSEKFKEIPEFTQNINRTTLSRNFSQFGEYKLENKLLLKQCKYIIKRHKVKSKNIRMVVDTTTIEVSKGSKYEGVKWVWDNAKKALVWGYEVTIIILAFNDCYIPVYFSIGSISKKEILEQLLILKKKFKTKIVLIDGGYNSDWFFESLTENGIIFYGKITKSWLFNNGLTDNVKNIRSKIDFKSAKFRSTLAYRAPNGVIGTHKYKLNMKKNDTRVIITNNLISGPRKAFFEFKIRWDIEVCNSELKSCFCFEKLPIRNLSGIKAYLFTCLVSLNLVTQVKLSNKVQLGLLFNKGFKKIIRWIILASAKIKLCKNNIKLIFKPSFKYVQIYAKYNLI